MGVVAKVCRNRLLLNLVAYGVLVLAWPASLYLVRELKLSSSSGKGGFLSPNATEWNLRSLVCRSRRFYQVRGGIK
jgi:hypothetical protein